MKIAEDVHLLGSGRLGAGYSHDFDCNVYAVRCGGHYLLVDSGAGIETEKLVSNLEADGVSARQIRSLLLTHSHLDHAGGAHWLHKNLGLGVCASTEAAMALESGDEKAISLLDAKKAGVYSSDICLRACKVDRVLQGNESWVVGDSSIQVIRTPGHSKDMVSYLIQKPDRLLLFSGDTVFHGGKILLSNVYDCDVPAYANSLRILAGYKIDALFPGHMMWVVRNARLHLQKTEEYLNRLLLPPNLI
jgi:hydroxyacylglutathione hydrolase